MNSIALEQIETLLPLACAWAKEQEGIILESGIALEEWQVLDARLVGVAHPERVRLQRVRQIPLPSDPALAAAITAAGVISAVTSGLTMRYGVFIADQCWGLRHIIVHQLAHVMQYERLGGFDGFFRSYLSECIKAPGYPYGPMEQEAFAVSVKLCG